SERSVYGEEAFALACARAAMAKIDAGDTTPAHYVLDTLAWALFANGQDAESKQRSAEALAKPPADEQERFRGYQRDIEAAIRSAPETLAAAEQELATLIEQVSRCRTPR